MPAMKVPLLDLKIQYQTIKNSVVDELNKMMDAQQFILGPPVKQLEEKISEFCSTRHAIGVNSGSDALLLSMMAMDITEGDIVITTPYTFFATCGSICRLGAIPMFVDIEEGSFNIDPEKLEDLLKSLPDNKREKVRAVIPVHLYGQCADMQPLIRTARKYNLRIIEDAAQAIGASYIIDGQPAKACEKGDFACLSFFPSKNLGGFGDGGMITTNNDEWAEKLYSMRVHGESTKYFHQYIGINGRLDALQAAVLLIKLPLLNMWASKRRENANCYNQLFKDTGLLKHVTTQQTPEKFIHVFNQFVIRVKNRDDLKKHLEKNGVGCAIYYPLCLHEQECFSYLGYKSGDFPVAEKAAAESLALPVFPELEKEQLEYVVDQIKSFYKKQ